LPWAPEGLVEEITEKVLQPTIDELRRRGTPFSGLLYAGLALTSRGLRVIEFNCRFGDPETQALLPLLKTPLGGLLYAAAKGKLADAEPLAWKSGASVAVVMAAKKYPAKPRNGDVISGIDQAEAGGVRVFHAGTAIQDGEMVTAGGRVLAVSGTGKDLDEARQRAYAGVGQIRIKGSQHRTDIALKAARGEVLSSP
jgi:phosphoribosylamine--glycine ligase